MKLIVGGAFCGKEIFVKETYHVEPHDCDRVTAFSCPAVSNLQDLLKDILLQGGDTDHFIEKLICENPNAIILCDEIGMGIVPMDRDERCWREAVGRACCALSKKADEVVRVVCGLPVYLKGQNRDVSVL